jgi:hypothetical protein
MNQVWMRVGDNADYESFDSMFEAGDDLGAILGFSQELKRVPVVRKINSYGVEIEPFFTGYNYVSLFWGDEDAQPEKSLTQADIASFKAGIREGLDIQSSPRKPSAKRKSSKRSSGNQPTSLRGIRG